MSNALRNIGIGTLVTAGLAGMIFAFGALDGSWGVRRTIDIYTSQYHGLPAILQRKDVRFGPDEYLILIGGRDKIKRGSIVTDDGKSMSITPDHYSIKDYRPEEE